MILSGLEIKKQLGQNIFIEPFDENQLNPNSYDLKLNNKLLVYSPGCLDMKQETRYEEKIISEKGYVLMPGIIYLCRTVEYTKTLNYIPMIEGRSSIGRLGIFIHATAGFGDVGFRGFWTLEISCIAPVKIYPFVKICQIYYHTICGEYEEYKSNKYQNNTDVQPSLLYKDFI
jgi:dCTP deaminase